MRKIFLIVAHLFIYYPAISQATDSLSKKIDEYITPYVKTKNFSGAVLVSDHNRVIYKKAFGNLDEELNIPNRIDTKFNIASVSKLFTATGILLLQQKGLLSTRDHVSKFYPSLPYADKITIHQLLTHTSGVPNINNLPGYDSLSVFPQTPESLIQFIKDKPLDFEPGKKYSYSNTNYNLLALIIEKVSGLSYGAFMEKMIFNPLGLKSTGHHNKATDIIPGIAKGYMSDGNFGLEKAPYLDWTAKTGNGSLYTTIEDLYRFRKALDTNILLTDSSRGQLFTNHFENVGYGTFLSPHLNKKRQYINGRSPGVSSYLAEYPDDHLIIIVLSNNYVPLATAIGMDIA
ncbi:MAG: serine hydrolase domain-containing protein, partial [Candidatus Paceibacterales bacterium]